MEIFYPSNKIRLVKLQGILCAHIPGVTFPVLAGSVTMFNYSSNRFATFVSHKNGPLKWIKIDCKSTMHNVS